MIEIHFVTGKGGVGKTTLSAALASKFAREGHRTLLAELGTESSLAGMVDEPLSTYEPASTSLGFSHSLLSANPCLREYATHLIKISSLVDLFLNNPVSKALIDVAPSLNELAILGKITSGPPRHVGPPMSFDRIVVDAYSSGHFMALLRGPEGMSRAIDWGPMAEQTKSILACLRDPKLCHYHVVCLPEALPLEETLELTQQLRSFVGFDAHVWLNKWLDFPPMTGLPAEIQQDLVLRKDQQETVMLRLQKEFPGWNQTLPLEFQNQGPELIQALSRVVRT